jgi:hypothetical protein
LRPALALSLVLAAAIAGAAFATPPPTAIETGGVERAAADAEIVVRGGRARYSDALADVRALATRRQDQLPRFEGEVCPLVLGLAPQFAGPVARRIGEVAARVGLRPGRSRCAPNLTVIVADHGGEVIAALQKRLPNLFGSMTARETDRLNRHSGPAWNWYALDPKRRDGGPVEKIRMISFGYKDPPRPVSPNAYIASNVFMSRLMLPVRLELASSFVVLDSGSIYGLTARQVGDLSAMLGLSMLDVRRLGSLRHSSVLQLLQDKDANAERIRGLTDFDVAYLTGLYSGSPGQSSTQRSANMASRVLRGPPESDQD